MANKLRRVESSPSTHRYAFHCPACGHSHLYEVPRWQWNGSLEKPTFTPSLLNTTDTTRCHLFVTDGRIAFCGDCTHPLAGKTVEMEDTE